MVQWQQARIQGEVLMGMTMDAVSREQQMDYLRRYRGLIGVRSKVPVKDSAMLSLLYTPGVAEVCRAIVEQPLSSFGYTCRGNTVALVSNASGLFGLKGAPPEAALPALEGKAIIFKTFAGIDALPIVLDAEHTTDMVETLATLGPSFGAVCLEDIAAPRSLQVAALLEQAMTIPVVSNHQHIVAIGTLAALMNAAQVVGKDLKDLHIVINGAGAAANGLVDLLAVTGVRNVIVCDRHGVLTPFRLHDMHWAKRHLAKRTNPERREGTLPEILCGADVFIGYSAGGVLTPDMVRSMAPDPIIFAFALPEPEILPPLAEQAGAAVVATARSDFANGINIALIFPGFFRGLLDVQALDINNEMLLGAARCLAGLIPQPSGSHILPDVLDFRVAPALAEAVARIALETGQARKTDADPAAIAEWTRRYIYEGQAAIVDAPSVQPDASLREKALDLRRRYRGALEIQAKLPIRDQFTLSMYLSPADALPAEAIARQPDLAYEITAKGNLVAIVTDGSAVLGLGNIGPRAGLPVMEGKAILFHTFAGVEAYPICVATQDTDEIVQIVQRLAPTFGGINLEDIAAPRCFEIESKLRTSLSIPVFHDDQHGTAVVVLAGLINALKIAGKALAEVRVVMNGAGAAGIAVTKMLMAAGVPDVILCDTKGIIYKGRKTGMNWIKEEMAEVTNRQGLQGTVADALRGADVFVGVSGPGVLTLEAIAAMAERPILFALANPDTEFASRAGAPREEVAAAIRAAVKGGAVVATGRSDFPNQVNNSLAFPGIFRGALDTRAQEINEAMKLAAAQAIAGLVPEQDLHAERIIPSGMDFAVPPAVAAAVAQAAMDSGVARLQVDPAQVAERTRRFIYEGYLA
jgi:malate dehydrogenase (oxaloacetate-decarboxylating)